MSDAAEDISTPALSVSEDRHRLLSLLSGFTGSVNRLGQAIGTAVDRAREATNTARDAVRAAAVGAQYALAWAEVEGILRPFHDPLIFGAHIPVIQPAEYYDIHKPGEYAEVQEFREQYIPRRDGIKLAVWHKQGFDSTKPVYVVFHGRRGHWGDVGFMPKRDINSETGQRCKYDRRYRLKWLKALADTGAEVIAVHLTGQGASYGNGAKPGEGEFGKDVQALADFLREKRIPPERVVLAGESMGGAVAMMLAEEMTRRGQPPGWLALINSFTSMRRCVRSHFRHIPSPRINGAVDHKFESFKRMKNLNPEQTFLYLAHAPGDEAVNISHYRRLQHFADRNNIHVVTRDLVGDYMRTDVETPHTGWDARQVVADMDEAFMARARGEIRPGDGNGQTASGIGR